MRLARDLLIVAGFVTAILACDHWPGVSEDGTANGNVSPSGNNTVGTCSGTPLPCGSLSGTDCNPTAGCKDLGSCTGTPSNSGAACGALSYQGCLTTPGCLWAPNCTGTPFGTCSAITESACLVAKGCVFTPTGAGGSSSDGGSPGSGGAPNSGRCDTYGATCKSNAECGCFLCVSRCATCSSVCGVPCLNDFDCAGASDGAGIFTPLCVGASAISATPTTGVCAATR